MKVFDMHTHASASTPEPERLLAQMEAGGIYGGCIFSNQPALPSGGKNTIFATGTDFAQRLHEVLTWTKGFEGRLFPILWIHPDEENILENIDLAVQAGICGFKIICNDFYVYEEKCMCLLRKIAQLDKPVFFHTGILWDGGVSSQYNRPLNWEALLEIEGLRFSMGHCAWPWIDECIALFGKFLEAGSRRNAARMFLDITPGTPAIYRRELLTKLYCCGYNTGSSVLFGTDCFVSDYRSEWAAAWLSRDRAILEELGVSAKNLQNLYQDNLLRFLGKYPEQEKLQNPTSDGNQNWTATEPKVKERIRYWFEKLNFPDSMGAAFRKALDTVPVSDAVSIHTYDLQAEDGQRNLLSFLAMCDDVAQFYTEKGIPEDILLDSLSDIPRWAKVWTDLDGKLSLRQLRWLSNTMSCKLFKLGRLQFCMGQAPEDAPWLGVQKGDPVVEVHIPRDGSLDPDACDTSFARAREFFARFFPDFHYRYFTCGSWLLGEELAQLLPEGSNILAFQRRFAILRQIPADDIFRYTMRWNITKDQVADFVCTNSFTRQIRQRFLDGKPFHLGFGILPR